MSNIVKTASEILLNEAALDEHQLETVLGKSLGKTIDNADLYLQSSQAEQWSLEDGIVKEGSFHIDRGFGLRVLSGEKVGFAYSDDINVAALTDAALSARSIVKSGGSHAIQVSNRVPVKPLYGDQNPLQTLKDNQKVQLLQKIDSLTRQRDSRVKQVFVRLAGDYDVMMILHSDGTMAADIRPLVNLTLRVIVEENGRREIGFAGAGARASYDYFDDDQLIESIIAKAVNQALHNLNADPAPAGLMPVILGPGWPGVLLHEAVGHGLEGDFNRRGSSAFSDRLGQKVASEHCTIVDNGTIEGRRGSLTVDDEGTPSQCTVLIENGVLRTYMQDRHNATLMNMQPTGNGRRESYAHLPIPRMTNTYMLAGEHDPAEIISSVSKGIYAVDFSGGQVDITSGKFVFTASEAYLIEDGKVGRPIKGATFIGDGPDILTKISMVGNDLQLDTGIGTCGKNGQSVPVGVGQPTLKIDSITVGGSK